MTAKLTLSVDRDVIKKAKQFSQTNGISISQMVETFLKQTMQDESPKKIQKMEELPPVLKKMYGAVKTKDKREYRNVYRSYIEEKYS